MLLRFAAFAVIFALPPLLPAGALAVTIIDSFETGAFSHSFSTNTQFSTSQSPSPAHCIAPLRELVFWYPNDSSGVLSASLVPQSGADDGMEVLLPTLGTGGVAEGFVKCRYEGGPWDLTEGGTQDRILIRVEGANPTATLSLYFEDEEGMRYGAGSSPVNAPGTYVFPFAGTNAVTSAVQVISVLYGGTTGDPVGIQDIRTSSGSSTPLTWSLANTGPLQWLCNSATPGHSPGPAPDRAAGPVGRGGSGSNALSWTWAVDWPIPQTLAGPMLAVSTVNGPNCSSVSFVGAAPGQFGDMGMVTVDWEAASFQNAMLAMAFTTDPAASYVAETLGAPVVTLHADGVAIGFDVALSGVSGVPDGVMHQDLIVSAHPAQSLTLDWAEAGSYSSGGAVGISFGFAVTATAFDPAHPLLEIFTTGTYSDDAGTTGVQAFGTAGDAPALAAHPSLTRSGTRFVLPAGAGERATIDVFNVTGRRVRRLEARGGEAAWDGTGNDGARVPAGVYFARAAMVDGAARVVVLR